MMEEYTFANSSSLDFPVHVKIGSLEGQTTLVPRSTLLRNPDLRHIGSNLSAHSDLYATVQLWADSKPLTVPVQTAYKPFKNARTWNQWLQLPLSIATLPLSAQLAITVWDLSPTADGEEAKNHAIPFGGTTVPLFGKDDTLQKGRQRCRVHRHKAADGFSSTRTPANPLPKRGKDGKVRGVQITEQERELERLEAVFKKHEMGEVPRVDWLDRLVFEEVSRRQQEVERVNKNSRRRRRRRKDTAVDQNGASEDEDEEDDDEDEERFTLTIEFPRFDFPVVFTDHEYKPTPISSQPLPNSQSGTVNLKPPPEVQYGPGIHGPIPEDTNAPPLIRIYDPEVGARDNPAENKHRRLVRSHRTGVLDRDLRPNAKIRDELNTIMSYGPTQELNAEEKDLVWKFRHHLAREKRALTKFIKSVNWSDAGEARQAVQMLPRWTEIDVDDALELLGPTFDNPAVRAYAVDRLRKADDDELLLYLLQLVQALKFEKLIPLEAAKPPPTPPEDDAVETTTNGDAAPTTTATTAPATSPADSSLASFLISRASQNFLLGNYLHWYLMVECDDPSPTQHESTSHRALYARVSYGFMAALASTPEGTAMRTTLRRQAELVTLFGRLSGEMQKFGAGQRTKMVSHARAFLADPKNELQRFDPPLPLPLDPKVKVTGIVAEETTVFKSSLHPFLLHFRTDDGRTYPVMWKKGDDLRQDQLVIQVISLMDRLLRNENLDLKLSPFRVLATSTNAGAVQFVPSIALQAAKTKYGGNYVLEWLKANNPDAKAELGVRREAMDNYVKSVAGYCVVTYLLGVGDRHLDNLLITPDGHFFHIDFGYILGRDPKPAPPPIKITLAMLDGMGGLKSENFVRFQQYCFTAYLALRKQSSLILNLFSLMQDANVPDIRVEPDKVVEKVRERFRLEVGEEEAMREFGRLVEDSLSRIVPLIVDGIHEWVQRYRG